MLHFRKNKKCAILGLVLCKKVVLNLSQEEELLVAQMMKLKYRETQLKFFGSVLSVVCPLSLIAISVLDAFNQSNLFRLLILLAYPATIVAMSINRRSRGIGSYLPVFALGIFLFLLKPTFPTVLCVLGIAAAYHMLFNSVPLVRLQLAQIEKSPLYPSICTKLIGHKMEEKDKSLKS